MSARDKFERTTCQCGLCVLACKHMPGYLVPADLDRIGAVLPLEEIVMASPGATAVRQGKVFQIETVVMAAKPDGSCVCLQPDGRCQIHEISPYGCAYFNTCADTHDANARSLAGAEDIFRDQMVNGPYTQLISRLKAAGRVVKTATATRRDKFNQAINDYLRKQRRRATRR
jgi:Fe-S-cluster containining protein